MKRNFIYFIIFLFSFFSFVLGSDTGNVDLTGGIEVQNFCIKDKYYIVGLEKVKKFTNVVYLVKTKENLQLKGKVTYFLLDSKGNILTSGEALSKIDLFFKKSGDYTLKVRIKEGKCIYNLLKKISVYDNIIVYLGSKNDKLLWIKPLILEKKGILFIDIFIPKRGYYTWDEFLKKISSFIYYLKNANSLIILYPNLSYIFDGLTKIQNLYGIDFSKKQIYLVKNISFLERKILLKYMKVLHLQSIGIVKPVYFLDFLNTLINNTSDLKKYVFVFKLTNITESKYFILSSVINRLIFNGFPSNLLSLILLIPLVLLIITFFRQMIGFHVFGVYNPLIFSLILVIFGFKFSLILFFVGFIAILISKVFIRKIYLLYSSKLTLFYTIYILILILSVYLLEMLGFRIITSAVFKNIFIVFPIISFGVVINKLIAEDTKILSIKFIVSLFEFLTLSFLGYFVFINTYLQNLFLVYPELIFVILLVNILIGRFTGLQLFEYFRFMPLIKKQLEE